MEEAAPRDGMDPIRRQVTLLIRGRVHAVVGPRLAFRVEEEQHAPCAGLRDV